MRLVSTPSSVLVLLHLYPRLFDQGAWDTQEAAVKRMAIVEQVAETAQFTDLMIHPLSQGVTVFDAKLYLHLYVRCSDIYVWGARELWHSRGVGGAWRRQLQLTDGNRFICITLDPFSPNVLALSSDNGCVF